MVNSLPWPVVLSLVLLAAAIASVWMRPIRVGSARFAPWWLFFAMAACSALAAGVMQPAGVAALAVTAACGYGYGTLAHRGGRIVCGIALLLLAFALGTHKLPGFANPIVIAGTLSRDAPPFVQYANWDKGAAGLILLALACRRSGSANNSAGNLVSDGRRTLMRALPIAAATSLAVLGVAAAIGYVRLDLKFGMTAAVFVAVNLFFTVVAEEALFRGFIQERLTQAMGKSNAAAWMPVLVSASLFGAAHAGGGATFALLAALAGLGYAWAYQVTRRIEAPILVHAVLNAMHFVCFSYPHLQ